MRNKLITGIVVFVIALVGTGLGSVVGRLVPALDSKPASAQGLTAQAAGPLTPSPVGSGFTYQGKLLNNGSPVSGSYDFTFRLYDEVVAGALVSGPISVTSVISNGLFTANLDFGSPAATFNGQARYLEIATRQTGGGDLLPGRLDPVRWLAYCRGQGRASLPRCPALCLRGLSRILLCL